MRWIDCIGPEGQRGRLRTYVTDIAMNIWDCDLLQQWNTQINIHPVSDMNHKHTVTG